jgi:transmembrane sensor
MHGVVDFPSRDVIETEACAWIARLDGDRAPSRNDIADLKAWMSRSPIHQQELLRLAELWGDLNILTELAIPEAPKPARNDDTLAATLQRQLRHTWQRLGTLFKPAYMVSLTLATIVAGSLVYNHQVSPVHQIYSTALGEQRRTTLPDGSVVQLNTATRVEIDFSKNLRKVRLLKGEAHFSVAHNSKRPFEVYAGDGLVRAVGTAFSVHLKERDIEVTVTEGRVELAALKTTADPEAAADNPSDRAGSTANQEPEPSAVAHKTPLGMLEAGKTTVFNDAVQAVQQLDTIGMMRKLSWRDGMLIFSGESLEEVVQQVSRYTDLAIVIADPSIRDVRIGGYFQVGETDAMLEALESSFGVRVSRISDTQVELSRAEHSPSLQ